MVVDRGLEPRLPAFQTGALPLELIDRGVGCRLSAPGTRSPVWIRTTMTGAGFRRPAVGRQEDEVRSAAPSAHAFDRPRPNASHDMVRGVGPQAVGAEPQADWTYGNRTRASGATDRRVGHSTNVQMNVRRAGVGPAQPSGWAFAAPWARQAPDASADGPCRRNRTRRLPAHQTGALPLSQARRWMNDSYGVVKDGRWGGPETPAAPGDFPGAAEEVVWWRRGASRSSSPSRQPQGPPMHR